MQVKFTRESDFRQERDFGAKISATFEFLAAHWRPLGKCIFYFVVPAALLMGLALGISQNQAFRFLGQRVESPGMFPPLVDRLQDMYYWLSFLGSFITYSLLGSTVYGYVRLRMDLPTAQEVTPRMVGEQIRRFAPRLLLSAFVMLLAVILGFALLFVPGIYLAVALSFAWAIQVIEDNTLSQSISRSIYLTKGNWWSTLGLTLVVSLIVGIIAAIFQIPSYLAMIAKVMHWEFLAADALMVGGTMLASVGQMVLYSVLFVALLFQYFNLIEQKEGYGLRALVDSLGTGAAPAVHGTTYRPDDDGEY